MTNVHGHRPDSTSTVDIVEVHEELVQISVLTGPPGAGRLEAGDHRLDRQAPVG